MRSRSRKKSPDYFFISLVVILVIFGLVMLTSASSDRAKTKFGDSYYYLKHQIINGLLPGILGFFITSLFFYRRFAKASIFLLILNIGLLLLVFTPLGFGAKGATRWLNFQDFSFQPGELLKITFLIYLAAWLSKDQSRGKSIVGGFFPFLFLTGSVAALLIFQPSTTTAVIILAVSIVVYFISGARFKFIIAAGLVALLGLSLIFIFGGHDNYRLTRIKTFLNPQSNELSSGYQINQTLLSIGSGGIFGVGFGESKTKLNYLPEPLADSIFAIIAEELGFVGAIFLVIAFFLLVWRGLMIAKFSSDNFGKLLAIGFASLIGLQAFINIGAVSGLIPLTGVPLPFISYGGTALAVFLTMCGIIVNISKYRR